MEELKFVTSWMEWKIALDEAKVTRLPEYIFNYRTRVFCAVSQQRFDYRR